MFVVAHFSGIHLVQIEYSNGNGTKARQSNEQDKGQNPFNVISLRASQSYDWNFQCIFQTIGTGIPITDEKLSTLSP